MGSVSYEYIAFVFVPYESSDNILRQCYLIGFIIILLKSYFNLSIYFSAIFLFYCFKKNVNFKNVPPPIPT